MSTSKGVYPRRKSRTGADTAAPVQASGLSATDLAEFEALADAAERGELTPLPDAHPRGQEGVEFFKAALMAATGASSPEEAASLALGRPRVGEPRRETRQWRIRAAADLDDAMQARAAREGITSSELIRRAVAAYLAA